jgi:hypothetical protein
MAWVWRGLAGDSQPIRRHCAEQRIGNPTVGVRMWWKRAG